MRARSIFSLDTRSTEMNFLLRRHFHFDLSRDRLCHLVLEYEHVANVTLVSLCPKVLVFMSLN